MKKIYGLVFILMFINHLIIAQGSLTGNIIDANGEPIPGVNISLNDGSLETASDADGFFMLNPLPNQVHKIEMSAEGFKTQSKNVEVSGRTFSDFVLNRKCWYYWIRFKRCR